MMKSQRDDEILVIVTPFFKVIEGWLVVLGLTALSDNISVYISRLTKRRRKRRKDRLE